MVWLDFILNAVMREFNFYYNHIEVLFEGVSIIIAPNTMGVTKGGVDIIFEEECQEVVNFLGDSYNLVQIHTDVNNKNQTNHLALVLDAKLKRFYVYIKYVNGSIYDFGLDYDLSPYYFLIFSLNHYYFLRLNFLNYFFFQLNIKFNFITVSKFDNSLFNLDKKDLSLDLTSRNDRVFISISSYWHNYFIKENLYVSVNFFKFNRIKNKFLWRNRGGYFNFNGFKILILDNKNSFIKLKYINSGVLLNTFYFITYGVRFNFYEYSNISSISLDYFGGYCNQKIIYKLTCFSKNYKNSIKDSSFFKHNMGKKEVKTDFKESIFFQNQKDELKFCGVYDKCGDNDFDDDFDDDFDEDV